MTSDVTRPASGDLDAFVERLAGIADELAAVPDVHERLLLAHRLTTVMQGAVGEQGVLGAVAQVRADSARAWLEVHPELTVGGRNGRGRRTQGLADFLGVSYSRAGEIFNERRRAAKRSKAEASPGADA